MEGSWRGEDVVLAPQGRWRYGCRGGGSRGDESGGGVELGLRLGTGSSPPAPVVVEQKSQEAAPAAARRRSLTIFYNGRVCAVDVTAVQAWEIISMANQEMLAFRRQQHREAEYRQVLRHLKQDRSNSTSSVTSFGGWLRCGGQARPGPAALPPALLALATTSAPATETDQVKPPSMKRSLQRFLQKRVDRRAEAVAPPYAGAGRQAQAMRH